MARITPFWLPVVAGLLLCPAAPLRSGGPASEPAAAPDLATQRVLPSYDDQGNLLLPGDYQRWVLAGSSLGLSYSEGAQGHEMFHHTLIEPTAYRHWSETGEFREGTMFVLLLHGIGEGVLPSRRGRFANEVHGVEMSVKDTPRSGGWAYYAFGGMDGLRDRAQAFPNSACSDCHAEHAQRDNVFLQFYPLLEKAAPAGTAAAMPAPDAAEVSAREAPAEPSPVRDETAQAAAPLALVGLDPVLLVDGREEMGKGEIVMTHEGYRYQFVSEPTRARFELEPERYSIQNETCPVAPGTPIDPGLFAVHDGKIYAFATEGCVATFEADPDTYVGG